MAPKAEASITDAANEDVQNPSERRLSLGLGLGLAGLALFLPVVVPPAYYSIEAWRAELVQVPAELDWCTAMTNVGHGGSDYWVEARYNYTYDGRRYHSERVGFFEQRWRSQNIQPARARRDLIRNRDPFFVYVDRRSPSRSVIFEDTSGMLTTKAKLFVLVPLALLAVAAWNLGTELLWRWRGRAAEA